MCKRLLSIALLLLVSMANVLGQSRNSTYENYIRQYASIAIDQMQRHHIPASITIAQGLLESGAGQSYLARVANNHFGIKVTSDWTGPYVVKSDDKPDDRFRKYNNAFESFEDHSLFLQKPRYKSLFSYNVYDYKSWAHGLKNCGYATSSTYAQNLIKIIELYNLMQLDSGTLPAGYQSGASSAVASFINPTDVPGIHASDVEEEFFARHLITRNNRNYYIRVLAGDNLKSISEGTGIKVRKLRRYNDMQRHQPVEPGQIIYLEKKHLRADRAFKNHPHIVTGGESMHDISQMYGMRLKALYSMNHLHTDYSPEVGDKLRVR